MVLPAESVGNWSALAQAATDAGTVKVRNSHLPYRHPRAQRLPVPHASGWTRSGPHLTRALTPPPPRPHPPRPLPPC